jgi:hypothetical protein
MVDSFEKTKRLMGALVRRPPKPHDEMKLGKRSTDVAESRKMDSSVPKKKSGRRPSSKSGQ